MRSNLTVKIRHFPRKKKIEEDHSDEKILYEFLSLVPNANTVGNEPEYLKRKSA